MKLKKIISILLTSCLLFTQLRAIIVEAPDLNRFEEVLKTIDQQSLVLFDVDETLLLPKDLILNPYVREAWNQYAKETIENPEIVPYGKYDDQYFLGQVLSKIEYKVVDPKVVEVIRSLQRRNIKTIAFTRMPVGPLGIIPSMKDWRIEHLKRHQFDFSGAFPHFQEVKINVLCTGIPSLFKRGMLCANKQDKGPVLTAFLDAIRWKPSQVIFIDNKLDYLKSAETALEGTGIDFIGFHYKDVENRDHSVNDHLAKFQLMHLAKTGEWLGDQEASAILWRMGVKIYFEEEDGLDYMGTKQLNAITRQLIKEITTIESDDCAENAKIFLKKENEKIQITHYEEKSRPSIGEELHATLLYTRPRGFCDSETLQQIFSNLFQPPSTLPSIEQVADAYSAIIQSEWKFQIEEVMLGSRENGPFCLVAKLLFHGQERIFVENKAISAGLHLTLVNFMDKSIFIDDDALDSLIKKLNDAFQGQQVKVAKKNDIADLEFGISGSLSRIRAGELIGIAEKH